MSVKAPHVAVIVSVSELSAMHVTRQLLPSADGVSVTTSSSVALHVIVVVPVIGVTASFIVAVSPFLVKAIASVSASIAVTATVGAEVANMTPVGE